MAFLAQQLLVPNDHHSKSPHLRPRSQDRKKRRKGNRIQRAVKDQAFHQHLYSNEQSAKSKVLFEIQNSPQALWTGAAAAIFCISVLPPRMKANDMFLSNRICDRQNVRI